MILCDRRLVLRSVQLIQTKIEKPILYLLMGVLCRRYECLVDRCFPAWPLGVILVLAIVAPVFEQEDLDNLCKKKSFNKMQISYAQIYNARC